MGVCNVLSWDFFDVPSMMWNLKEGVGKSLA